MMNRIIIMCVCTACLLFHGSAFCQNSSPEDKGSYRIGAGDGLEITVRAGGEVQIKTEMDVGDDGRVTVPFIGKIDAAGTTVRELEEKILHPLERDYFVEPQVSLRMTKYRSLQFMITGSVSSPGIYSLDFVPTIMELLANAGGVSSSSGSVAYILKESDTGASKTPVKVDLSKLLYSGDMSENIRLEPGDTVYIPEGSKIDDTRSKIFIEGRVSSPGIISYYPGLTAFTACIMAGGFSEYAAPNRTKIIREIEDGVETITVNLNRIQAGKDPDFPLQPGDRIHVPESWL